jgi:hypothetical protein
VTLFESVTLSMFDLRTTDADVVTQIVALADNHVSEAELADWIRTHSGKHK